MAPTAIRVQTLRGKPKGCPAQAAHDTSRAWLRQGCRASAGLGREAIDNSGRLQSDRARSFDPARTSRARWLRARLTLAPCRASQPSPCPSKRRVGGFRYLCSRPTSSHPEASRGMEKDASHRPLQPTFNTSTRIAVGVPLPPPPSLNLAAGGRAVMGLVACKAFGAHAPQQQTTTGGTSLDGEGPASATLHPVRRDSRSSGKEGPELSPCTPGGALIRGSCAPDFCRTAFSSERRACNLASGTPVAATSFQPSVGQGRWPPSLLKSSTSSKMGGGWRPGCLPVTSALSSGR